MRWLYIVALASMLILLSTVLMVVRQIQNKSQNDGELDEPKFAPGRRKENSATARPVIQTPIPPIAAPPPIAAQMPVTRRPVREEFQNHRPKSGAILLGMMAGAAILMLARTQKRTQESPETKSKGAS